MSFAVQHAVGPRLASSVVQGRKLGKKRGAAARDTTRVVASSASSDAPVTVAMTPSTSSRRSTLLFAGLSAASSLFIAAGPAKAERSGKTVCDPTENGADCRANEISKDSAELGDYESKSARKVGLAKTQTNPNLTNYQKETITLVDEVDAVLALDLYDLTREKRIAALKKDGNTWCSKYAPGGSAKTASG